MNTKPNQNPTCPLCDHIRKFRRALTAAELAPLLQASPDQLYRLARLGRIPSFTIGDVGVRFDSGKIAEWLEGQQR
jgi:predicted DNA-binding transcriptional regulator AlpA